MAIFSLDISTPPEKRVIQNVPANDWCEHVEPIAGLAQGDVLLQAAFTVKRALSDADTAGTSVQKIVNSAATLAGVIDQTTNKVTFWFTPADTAKMLSSNNFDIQVWVQRGSSVYTRTVVNGRITASADVTNTTSFIDPAASISITPSSPTTISGHPNDTFQLVATALDGGGAPLALNVVWASSNPLVASVDQTGLVRFWTNGTATITAAIPAYGLSATKNCLVADPFYIVANEGDIPVFTNGVWAPINPDTSRYFTQTASDARYYTRTQADARYAPLNGNPGAFTVGSLGVTGNIFLQNDSLIYWGAGSTFVIGSNTGGYIILHVSGVDVLKAYPNAVHAGIDAAQDLGAPGVGRFRDVYFSRNATAGGTITASKGVFTAQGLDAFTVGVSGGSSTAIVVNANPGAAALFSAQANGAHKWLFGRGVIDGSNDFHLYNYTLGTVSFMVGSSNDVASFSGSITSKSVYASEVGAHIEVYDTTTPSSVGSGGYVSLSARGASNNQLSVVTLKGYLTNGASGSESGDFIVNTVFNGSMRQAARFYSFGTVQLNGSLVAGSDAAYDIGSNGAARFRHLYMAGNGVFGGIIVSSSVSTSQFAGSVQFLGGTAVEGSVLRTSNLGLTIISATGGSYDFAILNKALTSVMLVASGTCDVSFPNGSLFVGKNGAGIIVQTYNSAAPYVALMDSSGTSKVFLFYGVNDGMLYLNRDGAYNSGFSIDPSSHAFLTAPASQLSIQDTNNTVGSGGILRLSGNNGSSAMKSWVALQAAVTTGTAGSESADFYINVMRNGSLVAHTQFVSNGAVNFEGTVSVGASGTLAIPSSSPYFRVLAADGADRVLFVLGAVIGRTNGFVGSYSNTTHSIAYSMDGALSVTNGISISSGGLVGLVIDGENTTSNTRMLVGVGGIGLLRVQLAPSGSAPPSGGHALFVSY